MSVSFEFRVGQGLLSFVCLLGRSLPSIKVISYVTSKSDGRDVSGHSNENTRPFLSSFSFECGVILKKGSN